MDPKIYLGDGAYARFDGYGVELTAENGIVATDHVYAEPDTLVALLRGWVAREPKLKGYLRVEVPELFTNDESE